MEKYFFSKSETANFFALLHKTITTRHVVLGFFSQNDENVHTTMYCYFFDAKSRNNIVDLRSSISQICIELDTLIRNSFATKPCPRLPVLQIFF